MSTNNPFAEGTDNIERKRRIGRVFVGICFASTLVGIVALVALLADVIYESWGWVTWEFLTYPPSQVVENFLPDGRGAGIYPAIIGSVFLIALTAVFTIFLGVGAAVYLEEYAADSQLKSFIEANIANLAGVPSIVYGLLGLAIFVRGMQLGSSLIAGALTLTLLILPIVIVSTQESLRSVPDSQRQAAYGVGATQWQVIRDVVLPRALPGIMTGTILSLSRAIGETAPILMVGAATSLFVSPDSLTAPFSAMPMMIFEWATLPEPEFQHVAAAGIVVLLTILLLMNAVAILIRNKYDPRS
ncbi:phosphate ABC transporter permease PstA [Natronorubrum bangense]|uniref:Phosphate transport system permease protein PstA n=2 Tax=Natronorubrum bangense TaxID=61858 RepID=L9WT20_9EURY|nr:phosphate ABC transporter permease PstA [Natronorubrum bangense]ELY52619.1 phosphate ABC transporter permease [Natronorubrum bangense JCM 10635]QCC55080.1 phosphate ABC transporter permease PstA [Natronorubrum bangense]